MNQNVLGLVILIIIGVMIYGITQGETSVQAKKIVKSVREFDTEKLTIYELPEIVSKAEQLLLDQYAVEFFQDDLPDSYKIKGQRDLLAEQGDTPQQTGNLTELQTTTPLLNQSKEIKSVKVSSLEASRTSATLIESSVNDNIHVAGSIIKIAGKIEMLKSAPYFYNIHLTCCGMDTFRVFSSAETDSQGNFLFKVTTDQKFPLGDWVVTLSTISDDNKIIKHFYNFKLIAPPERE